MNKALLPISLLGLVLLLGAGYSDSQASSNSSSKYTQADSASKRNSTSQPADDRGAKLFETHCGRCHKPPEDLSPGVAPAVLSHMRTRAMLSREDEELILKFLAP